LTFESGCVVANFVDNKEDKFDDTVGLLVTFCSLPIPDKLIVDWDVCVIVATTFLELMRSFNDCVDGIIVASNKDEKSGTDWVAGTDTAGCGLVSDKRREEKSGSDWVVGIFVLNLELVFNEDKSEPDWVFDGLTLVLDNRDVRLESNDCVIGILVLFIIDDAFVVVGNLVVLNKDDKSIFVGNVFDFESNETCVVGTLIGVDFCFCGKFLLSTANEGGDDVNLLMLVVLAEDKREERLDVDTIVGFEDNNEVKSGVDWVTGNFGLLVWVAVVELDLVFNFESLDNNEE